MNQKALGQRLKKLRVSKNITTTDLASMVGLSQAQISRLENGKQGFRSRTLMRLCEVLGVTPSHFYADEDAHDNIRERLLLLETVATRARAYLDSPDENGTRSRLVDALRLL